MDSELARVPPLDELAAPARFGFQPGVWRSARAVRGQPIARAALSRFLLGLFRTNVTYRDSTVSQLAQGPSIVICNHVSLLDGILVAFASPVPLVFAVESQYSIRSFVPRLGLRLLSAIGYGWVVPLDDGAPLGLRDLHRFLRAGVSVMLFPEGCISPDGRPRPHQAGLRWLMERNDVPVIELRIQGAEQSCLFAKAGERLWPPIKLLF